MIIIIITIINPAVVSFSSTDDLKETGSGNRQQREINICYGVTAKAEVSTLSQTQEKTDKQETDKGCQQRSYFLDEFRTRVVESEGIRSDS